MYVTDEKEEILLGHKHIDHFEALNNSMAYIFKGLFPEQLPHNHVKAIGKPKNQRGSSSYQMYCEGDSFASIFLKKIDCPPCSRFTVC